MAGVHAKPQAFAADATMELVIVRHGQTPGNAARRYVGSASDEPLSELGRQQARDAVSFPDVNRVYVSPMRRARETAAIMFPQASQVVVPGIQEMDFGVFTGRSADEMVDDEQYRAWVDGYCMGRCPGGESRPEFDSRVRQALQGLLREAAERGETAVHVVAHGGTLMSFMSGFADDERDYYAWHVGNCKGYRMQACLRGDDLRLEAIEPVG